MNYAVYFCISNMKGDGDGSTKEGSDFSKDYSFESKQGNVGPDTGRIGQGETCAFNLD